MTPTAALALLMALSPLIILIQHILFSRMSPGKPPQAVAIRTLVFSYIPMALICWYGILSSPSLTGQERACGFIYAAVVYSCLAYAYFHVYNMSETARRVRIMHEIFKAGGLSRESIIAIYGTPDILKVRLDRLVHLKELELVEGRYVLKGKILHLAAVVVMVWRAVLGFPPVTTSTKR